MTDALVPASIEAALEEIRLLERLSGGEQAAELLVSGLRKRLEKLRSQVSALATPRVLLLQGVDPFIASTNWKADVVRIAGGVPIAPIEGSTIHLGEIAHRDPDAIVLAIDGLGVAEALEVGSDLEEESGWRDLRAVKEGIVLVLDGSLLARATSRLGEAAEIIAFGLHGERAGVDVSKTDKYQEMFWPGASGIEVTDEIKSWAEARRGAWESAWRLLAVDARERANAAFESFRMSRQLVVRQPAEEVLRHTREMSPDLDDLEDHYFQIFFSSLNDLAFNDRFRRRIRGRLAGPPLPEDSAIEAITELLAIHDPAGIVFYPDNVDEYSIEAKAIVSMADGRDVATHAVAEEIVTGALDQYFGDLRQSFDVHQLVTEAAAVLSHRQ